MSTVTNFGGRRYTEPGVGARVTNATPADPLVPSAGIVLLVDTGSNPGFGFGPGVAGQLGSGKQALHRFNDLASLQASLRGGLFYDLASYLFNPNPGGTLEDPDDNKGVSQLLYIRAATTTAALITTAIGASTLKVRPLSEGTGANGTLVGDKLTRGFAARVARGSIDPTKVLVRYFQGGYAGADANGVPYNGFSEADSNQVLVAQSPEFGAVPQLVQWMTTNKQFTAQFSYDATSTVVAAAISEADIVGALGWDLAVGGTEAYNLAGVAAALDVVSEEGHTYILSDCFGSDAARGTNGTINQLLRASLNDASFPKFLVVGGGTSGADFAAGFGISPLAAQAYDSPQVIVVDGGCQVAGPNSAYGLLARPSLYTAATVLGRKCGLQPGDPVTYKPLARLKGLTNELGKNDRERALQSGVLHLKEVAGIGIVVNQGINTLQQNTRLINPDGHSHDWAIEAIDSALINRLQVQAAVRFVGRNRSQATEADVLSWTQAFLQEQIKAGLILRYESVTARLQDDAWFVEFGYVTNGPINKLFFTAAKV